MSEKRRQIEETDLEQRIKRAINFFRIFSDKADKTIYRKAVLKFCDLVERYLKGEREEDIVETAQKIFEEK